MFIFKILTFRIGLIFSQIHFPIFMLHRIAVRVWINGKLYSLVKVAIFIKWERN